MFKGFSIIWVLVGVVILGGIGFSFYKTGFHCDLLLKVNNPCYVYPDPAGIYPTPTSSSQVNTSDWKIYVSKVGKYQFKYPQDWEVISDKVLEDQGRVVMYYKVDGFQFDVYINAAERGISTPADEIKSENIKIGDYGFIKRSWVSKGTTLLIIYKPESNFPTGNIEIYLTPDQKKQQRYINEIESLIASFKRI